jgi:hypothetical protein
MNYAKFEGPMFQGIAPTPFVIIYKDGELHGHYVAERKLAVLNYMKRELAKDPEGFDLEKLAHKVGGVYYKVGVYGLNAEVEEGLHRLYPIKDSPEKMVESGISTAAKWARDARRIG